MGMTLRVALVDEDGRGLVRLAPDDMSKVGLTPGETIRLAGRRDCFGRAAPGHVRTGEIALDRISSMNAGLSPGQSVEITPAPLKTMDALHLRLDQPVPAGASDILEALFDMALTDGDRLPVALPGIGETQAEVAKALPDGAGLVGDTTAIVIETPSGPAHNYEGIAGLSEQIERVHEMVATPLLRPDLFRHLGLSAPRGVLFTGPPGSGKTLLARAVAARTKASFFKIDGAEVLSKHYGESEAALRRVFEAAHKAQPAIVFIDEIDALAPRRADLSGEKQVERRVVAQLLTLMDGLQDRGRLVVMAATNLPDALDPALRRPGRFDREVTFSPPTQDDRRAILALHLAKAPLAEDVDLEEISQAATGFVGADLASLAREAGMTALGRSVALAGGADRVDAGAVEITQSDLKNALGQAAPSLLRGVSVAGPPVAWEDIGGLEREKAELQQLVDWPRRHAEQFQSLGLRPARGVLLAGAPGTGKTLLARALAGTSAMNFIPVRPPDLLSQFLGQAERAVSHLFEKARFTAPSVLFFDELDALAPRRGGGDAVFDRIVAQFLVELDGIGQENGVTVLAATNRAAALDPALLRPGRFDRIIEIAHPDAMTRAAILNVHLGNRPVSGDVSIEGIATATNGANGAELAHLADTAAWRALSRSIEESTVPQITNADVKVALAELDQRRAASDTDFIHPGTAT